MFCYLLVIKCGSDHNGTWSRVKDMFKESAGKFKPAAAGAGGNRKRVMLRKEGGRETRKYPRGTKVRTKNMMIQAKRLGGSNRARVARPVGVSGRTTRRRTKDT